MARNGYCIGCSRTSNDERAIIVVAISVPICLTTTYTVPKRTVEGPSKCRVIAISRRDSCIEAESVVTVVGK